MVEVPLDSEALLSILKISMPTLIAMRNRKKNPIPAFKVGKNYRYFYSEVLEWLKN